MRERQATARPNSSSLPTRSKHMKSSAGREVKYREVRAETVDGASGPAGCTERFGCPAVSLSGTFETDWRCCAWKPSQVGVTKALLVIGHAWADDLESGQLSLPLFPFWPVVW